MPLLVALKWQRTQAKKILVANEVRQHAPPHGALAFFLLGEGGVVGFLLFPMCSHEVLILLHQVLTGFPMCSPSCSQYLLTLSHISFALNSTICKLCI